MRWTNRHFGTCLLGLSALLFVAVYYFAFRAGCSFDGKGGSGGMAAMKIAERYTFFSLIAILASFISAFLGIYALTRRHVQVTLAVFLLVLTFGVPFTLWLGYEGDTHGTQSCHPSLST
jgi:hypothetical protein